VDLIFVIILGGLWGSFANVCIYRLPINKGVVSGDHFVQIVKNNYLER